MDHPLEKKTTETPTTAVERLKDKPLEKWTNQELIDWAEEVYDDVVDILMREQYDGLILAVWTKDDFKQVLGIGYGAAFYECLRRHGKITAAASSSNPPPTTDYPPIEPGMDWHRRPHLNSSWVPSHAEGVSLWDPKIFRQESLCAKWCNRFATQDPQDLRRCSAVIFRAPPLSGKTSFGSLMAFHATSRWEGVRAYLVRAHASEADRVLLWSISRRSWDPVPLSLRDILKDPADNYSHVVIIDEAQHSYVPKAIVDDCMDWTKEDIPYPLYLWARIKQLTQRDATSRIKVLVMAAYGSEGAAATIGTPVRFDAPQELYLPSMFLSHAQFWVHLDTYINNTPRLVLYPVVREMLWRLTRGHIAHLSRLLSGLQRFVAGTQGPLQFRQAFRFLTAAEALQTEGVAWDINESASAVLKLLVWARHGMLDTELLLQLAKIGVSSTIGKATLCQLEKSGVIFIARNIVSIPVPLLRWHLAAKLYPANSSNTYEHPFDLLVAVLGRMDSTILRTTLSRKDKNVSAPVYEAVWQDEFYRCLYLCRPATASISPEFGTGSRKKDPDGFVDFYITNLKWAFELLREGSGISEHLDRFKERGCYYDLVLGKEICQWLVVDFRSIHKSIRLRDEHLVHVRYNDTMTEFIVEWGQHVKRVVITAVMSQDVADEYLMIMQRATLAFNDAIDPNESVDSVDHDATLPYSDLP